MATALTWLELAQLEAESANKHRGNRDAAPVYRDGARTFALLSIAESLAKLAERVEVIGEYTDTHVGTRGRA